MASELLRIAVEFHKCAMHLSLALRAHLLFEPALRQAFCVAFTQLVGRVKQCRDRHPFGDANEIQQAALVSVNVPVDQILANIELHDHARHDRLCGLRQLIVKLEPPLAR